MKILLIGGGNWGDIFYPLIAIAEETETVWLTNKKIANMKLYYMADVPYNQKDLDEQFHHIHPYYCRQATGIFFHFKILSTCSRRALERLAQYFNCSVCILTLLSARAAMQHFLYWLLPRFLRIPVIIHESDTVPGRVNKWSGKFARKVALFISWGGRIFWPEENFPWRDSPFAKASPSPLPKVQKNFSN